MRKRIAGYFIFLFNISFFVSVWTTNLLNQVEFSIDPIVFREHQLNEKVLTSLNGKSDVGKHVALCMFKGEYVDETRAIWNDVMCFPVADMTGKIDASVSYVDTWMTERTYGGKRGHEGTDIMASKNERGLYPIISMTDGTITQKGWLDKGGYRIGITTASGVYFYYAHLDSYANVVIGDHVNAGDILGYMGDSGYGEEGTIGRFPVHLHLGIYITLNGKEISINPYWLLRYIENKKVKCYTEV